MLGLLIRSQTPKDSQVCYSNCQPPKRNCPAKWTAKLSRRHLDRRSRIAVEILCFLHPVLQTFPELLLLKSWWPIFASPDVLSFFQMISSCSSPFCVCSGKKGNRKTSLQFPQIDQIEVVFFALKLSSLNPSASSELF
ncbi:hypothetical protein OS493_012054 [Desmophyllum pertusum]|uniref:Uncharacterized protein n=1 Tax=Desmophyllum pertusum TaxID=174260 RepID=A0A9X0A2S6_9CNID|nr:hypothetical protein OS493_012054 [Desmophyllum pertusum]